jgi:hypothetical protein
MERQKRSLHLVIVQLAVLGLCLVAARPAAAQIGFEQPDYDGSADGVAVTGQQGWYIPPVTGSTGGFVYTYVDNAPGIATNALGEDQFLGEVARGTAFPRAQLDFDWTTASVWTVSYDFAARYNGILPAMDNVGSFSLQNSLTARYFIAVNTWFDTTTATNWNALYNVFTATGDPLEFLIAGPQWVNLPVDHWFRQSTTFDLDSNSITSVSITDLDTGDTATVAPNNWYLAGGSSGGGLPAPTALRFFVGGGGEGTEAPGNVMGWDNLLIEAGAGPAAPRNESPSLQGKPTAGVTN